jgi:hypothetical protein
MLGRGRRESEKFAKEITFAVTFLMKLFMGGPRDDSLLKKKRNPCGKLSLTSV